MHVLFLVSSLHGGGAERVAATLANAWVRRGDTVTLVCCFSGRGRCEQQLDDRVRLRWLMDDVRGPRGLRPFAKILALRRMARRLRPDRVLSFLTNVNVLTLLATWGLGLRVVVGERTDPAHSENLEPVLRTLRRWTYPWAHTVVVQTAQSMAHLRQVAPRTHRVRAIPNPLPDGLPDVRTDEPTGGRHVLAALGRFNPVKQFDGLIRVFSTVAADHPDWDLWIWGEGDQRPDCLRLVGALGLEGRVHLPGFSKTPWKDLANAHVFVLNSRVEGFPNAMLEAMAIGLPCVATDCPSGPRELSADGRVAALVPLDDEPALARALVSWMGASPEDRRTRGRAAAESIRGRYGLDAVLQAWDGAWADTATGWSAGETEQDRKG